MLSNETDTYNAFLKKKKTGYAWHYQLLNKTLVAFILHASSIVSLTFLLIISLDPHSGIQYVFEIWHLLIF